MNKILKAMAFSAAVMALPAQAYVGIGGGKAKINDSRENSYKIFAGSQPNHNIGLEIAYNDFGKHGGARVNSASLAAIGTLPVAPNCTAFAKLGASRNQVKEGSFKARRTGLLAGVGVGYNFNQNLGIRFEYENFGKLAGTDTNVKNLGVNIKYSF